MKYWLALFFALLCFAAAQAEEASIALPSGETLSYSRYPSQGGELLLWFASERGLTHAEIQAAHDFGKRHHGVAIRSHRCAFPAPDQQQHGWRRRQGRAGDYRGGARDRRQHCRLCGKPGGGAGAESARRKTQGENQGPADAPALQFQGGHAGWRRLFVLREPTRCRCAPSSAAPLCGNALGERTDWELLRRVNARRRVFLSSTRVRGRYALRICVLSFRTHEDRVREAVKALRDEAASLLSP